MDEANETTLAAMGSHAPDPAAMAVAWTRVVLGAALVAAPRLTGTVWLGAERASDAAVAAALRGFGARDIALGLGPILAARRGRPTRGWFEAGVLADATDAVAALVSLRALPMRSRFLVPLGACAAMAAGIRGIRSPR